MRKGLAAGLSVLFLGGCLTTGDKQSLGTAIGGAVGGVAGAQISKRGNRIPGIAGGAAIGAFVGNRIGKYLDDQDKQRLEQATVQTAESGRAQEIRSPDSGATIRTVAVQPAPETTRTAGTDRPCRTVRQTVELRDGSREQEDVTVCKGPNGWEAV